MKKTLAVLMALTLLLCLSAPLYALADDSITLPDNEAPTASYEPEATPELETARSAPIDVDPGGDYIDLTQVITAAFQVLMTLIFAIITRYVIPWIKARTSTWQYGLLRDVTFTAIEAAEQKLGAGAGKDKLNYVISKLHDRGFTVDEDLIESLVRLLPENVHKGAKQNE